MVDDKCHFLTFGHRFNLRPMNNCRLGPPLKKTKHQTSWNLNDDRRRNHSTITFRSVFLLGKTKSRKETRTPPDRWAATRRMQNVDWARDRAVVGGYSRSSSRCRGPPNTSVQSGMPQTRNTASKETIGGGSGGVLRQLRAHFNQTRYAEEATNENKKRAGNEILFLLLNYKVDIYNNN